MAEEPETTLFPPYKELMKVAEHWEYGSFHSHEEIAAILGIEYGTRDYYSSVNWVSDEMAFIGKRIQCVYDKGYRVLFPAEYPEAAYTDTKRAGRVLKTGIDKLHHAPTKDMDHGTQKKVENIGVNLARTYVTLVSTATEVKHIAGIERGQKMLGKAASGKVN